MARSPSISAEPRVRGRLSVGTSGFAYPGWSPRFYPAGLRADGFLAHYASHLGAVELNNTYYQSPKPDKIDLWLAATPDTFRFAVKAQRGGSFRAMSGDPGESVAPSRADPRTVDRDRSTVPTLSPGRRRLARTAASSRRCALTANRKVSGVAASHRSILSGFGDW